MVEVGHPDPKQAQKYRVKFPAIDRGFTLQPNTTPTVSDGGIFRDRGRFYTLK